MRGVPCRVHLNLRCFTDISETVTVAMKQISVCLCHFAIRNWLKNWIPDLALQLAKQASSTLTRRWVWRSSWLRLGLAGNPGQRPVKAAHLCSSMLFLPTPERRVDALWPCGLQPGKHVGRFLDRQKQCSKDGFLILKTDINFLCSITQILWYQRIRTQLDWTDSC